MKAQGVSCALLEEAKRLICKYERKRINLKDYKSLSRQIFERQICTIRKILIALLNGQRLTDDTLHTVLVQCEEILNTV